MENKKLLKFLRKDIAEIEEIFAEKGKSGFDNFEIEFIQSRFAGAKQILQILSEKENQIINNNGQGLKPQEELENEISSPVIPEISHDIDLPDEIEELVKDFAETEPENEEQEEEPPVIAETIISEEPEAAVVEEEQIIIEKADEQTEVLEKEELEMEEDVEPFVGGQRLGDSFSKEKSVNDILANDNNKLEYKISNSPVTSIQAAIGINDRYQYIRELFDGSGDKYTEAVTDLDKMSTIQEAVAYLQLNYKWKKTETSLKFVNLVKRRFANA